MAQARAEIPAPPISPRVWVPAVVLAGLIGGFLAFRAPMAAVLLPFAAALVVFGLRRPVLFYSAFILYGSLELFFVTRLPDSLFLAARMASEVLLVVVSVGVIATCALRNGGLRRTPIDVPFAAFLLVALVSAFWNRVAPVPALLGLRILLRFSLVYFALMQLRPRPEEFRTFFRALLAALIIQVAIGLLQAADPSHLKPLFLAQSKGSVFGIKVTGGQSFSRTDIRTAIFGTMENYNNYGAFLALALPIVYAYRALRRGAARFWLGLLLLAGVSAVILTGSRSSMLAVAAAALTALLQYRQRLAGILIALAAVLLVGGLLFAAAQQQGLAQMQDVPVYTNSVLHRWMLLFQPGALRAGPGANFRLYLVQRIGAWILTRSPVIGMGIGTFGSLYSIQTMQAMYKEIGLGAMLSHKFVADCNWITIYAQTGILGLIAFIAILVRGSRVDRRRSGPPPWKPAASAPGASGPAWRGALPSGPSGPVPLDSPADGAPAGVRALQEGFRPFLAAFCVIAFFGPYFETRYLSFLLWVFLAVFAARAAASAAPVPRGRE